jgi:energy-coupling factor transport system ATP-binding protein
LAKLLSGILKMKKGEIYMDGKSIQPYRNPGQLFGYSFQNPDEQLFSRTVLNEITGDKRNELYTQSRMKFLKLFGLENLQHLHPAELPFVMRKRISLAATLANDRPWYIIDEPTIGQDDDFVVFLVKLFKQLTEKGKGIVIISHSQVFIEKFQSKVLYLVNGNLKNQVL